MKLSTGLDLMIGNLFVFLLLMTFGLCQSDNGWL